MALKASIPEALENFEKLPDDAFVRLPVVCGLFACKTATVWRMARDGRIPAPVKLGPRHTAWKVGSLRATLSALSA